MTNVNNTATHFDLHTTGVGYLNRAREVKPQTGKKFKPFWSVGISALRGNIDEVEYSRIDTIIVGSEACELIKQYKEDINQQNSRVLCGFKIGDIYADPFKTTQGENRAVIKGRLLAINWIKIDGKMVYKAEKPQAEAQKLETSATEETSILPNKTVIECPFSEQLGKQVTVLKDELDFDRKVAWLTSQGYKYDSSNNCWNLPQQ